MRRLIISIVLTLLLTVWAHRLYLTEAGFDGKLFIIIITLAYMVCYKLVQYLARFKIVENNCLRGLRDCLYVCAGSAY